MRLRRMSRLSSNQFNQQVDLKAWARKNSMCDEIKIGSEKSQQKTSSILEAAKPMQFVLNLEPHHGRRNSSIDDQSLDVNANQEAFIREVVY